MQSPENSSDFALEPPTPSSRKTFKGLRGPACNRIDLTGQTFAALTVLGYHGTNTKRKSLWKCRCECGNESIVSGIRLRSSKTKSCGCLQKRCRTQWEYRNRGTKYDLAGKTFGRLSVLAKAERPAHRKTGTFWECRCSCGEVISLDTHQIVKRSSTSCGCARREFLNKKDYGKAAENSVILMYRTSASSRKLPYSLTDDECLGLVRSKCHYCGCGPKNIKVGRSYNGRFYYNGIDRIDNSKGYETTNVVPCCIDCNRAKRQMGYQEFLDWVTQVYKHVVSPAKSRAKLAAPLALFS